MRGLILACLLLCRPAPAWGQPAPTPPTQPAPAQPTPAQPEPPRPPDLNRQSDFNTLKSDYAKRDEERERRLRESRTPEDRASARKEFQQAVVNAADRAVKLADREPKDEIAFESAAWVLRLPYVEGIVAHTDRALRILREHHLAQEHLAEVCEDMFQKPVTPEAEKFLSATVENTAATKRARGLACFRLGVAADDSVGVLALADKGRAALAQKQAEAYYDQARREFGSVAVGVAGGRAQTLEALAKRKLFRLRDLAVGNPVPALVCVDLMGRPASLADYRGKVVVLEIWATWSAAGALSRESGRDQLQQTRGMVQKYRDRAFAYIGVSVDQEREDVVQFLERESMPWVQWYNGPTGGVVDEWDIRTVPAVFVIDAKGTIRFRDVRGKELERAVTELMREATGIE